MSEIAEKAALIRDYANQLIPVILAFSLEMAIYLSAVKALWAWDKRRTNRRQVTRIEAEHAEA